MTYVYIVYRESTAFNLAAFPTHQAAWEFVESRFPDDPTAAYDLFIEAVPFDPDSDPR